MPDAAGRAGHEAQVTHYDDGRPERRHSDNGLIAYFERRLSKTAKVATAIGTIATCLIGGGAFVYKIDGIYVHNEVFAGEMSKVTERLDRSDLRTLEGQVLTRRGQLLDLERKNPLTPDERAYLNTLKGEVERLQRDIDDLRAFMRVREQQRH